jgi:hypothetical protein
MGQKLQSFCSFAFAVLLIISCLHDQSNAEAGEFRNLGSDAGCDFPLKNGAIIPFCLLN